jgi:hypothetical protein
MRARVVREDLVVAWLVCSIVVAHSRNVVVHVLTGQVNCVDVVAGSSDSGLLKRMVRDREEDDNGTGNSLWGTTVPDADGGLEAESRRHLQQTSIPGEQCLHGVAHQFCRLFGVLWHCV